MFAIVTARELYIILGRRPLPLPPRHTGTPQNWSYSLSGPEFTHQYFIYDVQKSCVGKGRTVFVYSLFWYLCTRYFMNPLPLLRRGGGGGGLFILLRARGVSSFVMWIVRLVAVLLLLRVDRAARDAAGSRKSAAAASRCPRAHSSCSNRCLPRARSGGSASGTPASARSTRPWSA